MIFRRPCNFDSFVCTAEKCTDNCCIGWEICIDSETAELYLGTEGDFGDRLRRSISTDDGYSFILEKERCPFLNKKNLCDIITNLGEDCLCQICRDHPRWFEWYGEEKEGGISLSCEEAARLILTDGNFADYYESETDEEADEDFDSESFDFLFTVREKAFDILSCEDIPLEKRLDEILRLSAEAEAFLCGNTKEESEPFTLESERKRLVPILSETEAIDEKWLCQLEKLRNFSLPLSAPDSQTEKYLTRISAYFLWRYFLTSVFDFCVTEKVRLAVFSVTAVYALYLAQDEQTFDTLLRSAVIYSKQMEYSNENLETFFASC